jgi:hypothetical protein
MLMTKIIMVRRFILVLMFSHRIGHCDLIEHTLQTTGASFTSSFSEILEFLKKIDLKITHLEKIFG